MWDCLNCLSDLELILVIEVGRNLSVSFRFFSVLWSSDSNVCPYGSMDFISVCYYILLLFLILLKSVIFLTVLVNLGKIVNLGAYICSYL